MTKPKPIWHQQEKESIKAFEAFVIYCELPYVQKESRSCARVGDELGKSEDLIKRWSRNHNWQERIRAYDAMMTDKRQQVTERVYKDDVLQMHERHKTVARTLVAKVIARLNSMTEEQTDGMTIGEMLKMFEVGIKVEKEAIGQPSTIIGNAQFAQLEKALGELGLTLSEVMEQIIAQAVELKEDD